MKIPTIKKLAENETIADLKLAEEAILNEEQPIIEVEGKDEGEKLTHVLAAIYIKEEMEKGATFIIALRSYSARVRTSIS